MSDLNKKNINYGALNRFYQDLKNHDLSGLATEEYVDDAIGSIEFPEYSAGSNISISDDKEISCTYQYTLPTASSNTLGGVKVGSGLSINNDVLSTNVSGEEVDTISNSVIDINKEVRYLTPLNEQYLTFEAVTECTIKFICNTSNSTYFKTIEVSKDKLTWTSVTSSYYDSYSAPSGGTLIANLLPTEKIYLRGNNNAYAGGTSISWYNNFKVNGEFNAYGNIMSLINSTNFNYNITFTSDYVFGRLFYYNSGLIDASDLLLPATSLTEGCYREMFYGCNNLISAPVLPATILSVSAYMYMFSRCSNLQHIKCLAVDISAEMCTYGWVRYIATNGIFEKNSNMTSWTTGNDGIPTGWTTQDYVEPNHPATEDYVDSVLATKANKVDFIIPVDMQTQVTDWTVLNNAEEGIYRVKVVMDMMGTSVTMLEGWATVTKSMGNIAQTLVLTQMIVNSQGSPLTIHNRVSANGGTTWFDYEFNLGVINDNNSSSESTYSSSKINSLISALEARIAALEGNTTVS